MITDREADRVEAWIHEAVQGGANLLSGGKREGALIWPTVLEEVPEGFKLDCREVYGPVVVLYRGRSLEEAIERANCVDYGLHAAIFTENGGVYFDQKDVEPKDIYKYKVRACNDYGCSDRFSRIVTGCRDCKPHANSWIPLLLDD